MNADDLSSLPLSRLEELLKKIYMQRPDLSDRILQPSELTDYIAWMARTFSRNPEYQLSEDALPAGSTQMNEIGRQILNDPGNFTAMSALSHSYENQQEDRYIISQYDISVGRMLRYMPSHWHKNEYFEIYYAFSGTCPVYFEGEVIQVGQGTVLIVAPGVVHATPCYQDDQVLIYYMVRSSTFDQVFWKQLPSDSLLSRFFRIALGGEQPNAYLQFEAGNDPEIRELLFQLYREFLGAERYRAQLLNSLMTTFFILLLRRYEGTARLPRSEGFFWKHEFSAILTHIQNNYADVKISDLTDLFHYSERQITRIVQRCTGLTFSALVGKLRMENAAALLSGTDLPVEAISGRVGYANLSSFYRSFTRFYGKTPADYRRDKS